MRIDLKPPRRCRRHKLVRPVSLTASLKEKMRKKRCWNDVFVAAQIVALGAEKSSQTTNCKAAPAPPNRLRMRPR
jgi:hypothetical protein